MARQKVGSRDDAVAKREMDSLSLLQELVLAGTYRVQVGTAIANMGGPLNTSLGGPQVHVSHGQIGMNMAD